MTDAVIFDLDGTLADSVPDLHASANAMLEESGLAPLTLDTVRGFVGDGVAKLVERVLRASELAPSPAETKAHMAVFLRKYEAAPVAHTVLYPGVLDLLQTLKAEGYALGVCTNKHGSATRLVLEGLEIADSFGAVYAGDTLPKRKPDPAPLLACRDALEAHRVLYVGDSEVDAETAERAGIPFAFFTRGYCRQPLDSVPRSYAFDDFNALPEIIRDHFTQA